MSNDRIWVTCTTCGRRTTLAGYLPSCNLMVEHPDQLVTFFNEHLLHHPLSVAYAGDLARTPGFAFETDQQIGDRGGWRANDE